MINLKDGAEIGGASILEKCKEATVDAVRARISNSTVAKVAICLAAATGTNACGGSSTSETSMVQNTNDIGCEPIPVCPAPRVGIYGSESDPDENYYLREDRWFRMNPVTGELIKVCEPISRNYCQEDESPEIDGCSPPLCEGAKACDPIPSRASNESPYMQLIYANLPTSTENMVDWDPFYYQSHKVLYPSVYDNTPDCEPGEDPKGSSYYSCDMIPTCETTIPYCRPMRRCEPNESPISCSEGDRKYSDFDTCFESASNIESVLGSYGLDFYPGLDNDVLCQQKWDSGINEYYFGMPSIDVVCLPIPECKEGEEPVRGSRLIHMDCGEYGSWINEYDEDSWYPSCDPIKSCE